MFRLGPVAVGRVGRCWAVLPQGPVVFPGAVVFSGVVAFLGPVLEQCLHQRAVGDRRLPQVLGAGVAALVRYRDLVGLPVVRDNLGVLDGDIVRLAPSTARLVPWSVWSFAREVVRVGGNVLLF